ncbi:MAG: CHAT domain-containing tetratricopeptide repeat protein, partial [Calditrichota bacterium]
ESLQRYVTGYGEDHPLVSYAQLSLGAVAYQQSEYDSAEYYFELAKEMRDEIYGPVHELTAEGFEKYAEMYEHQGELDKSLVEYQKALGALSYTFNSTDLADNPTVEESFSEHKVLENMSQKARVLSKRYRETGDVADLKLSLATYERVAGFVETLRSGYKSEGAKLFLGKQSTITFDGAIQTALTLTGATGDESYLEKAFFFAERNKSGTLLEAMNEVEAKQFAGIPDSLLETERRLRFELSALNQRVLQSREKGAKVDSVRASEWKSRLFDQKLVYEKLIQQLEIDYPAYYRLKYKTADLNIKELRKKLIGKKDALVEYMLGDSIVYAFVLTRKKLNVFQIPRPDDLERQIKLMRTGLIRDDRSLYTRYASQLYELLISPLKEAIHKKKHLQIIPDGILGYLPFEALLQKPAEYNSDYASMDYLLRDVTIGYSYSARLMLETLERNRSETSGYFAVAPVFEDADSPVAEPNEFLAAVRSLDSTSVLRGDGRIRPLPATRQETAAVAGIFGKKKKRNTLLVAENASESALQVHDLSTYRYLHFATHGFVNEKEPQLSGLLLGEPDSSLIDNVLYASEVYNMDLNADLVVLSACETGLGKVVAGEGVIGLTRGFLYAGAKNLAVSLWQVSDLSTAKLMTDFFQRVAKGKKLSDSLRKAKLRLLESENYASPYYWSPFILIGK